MNTDDLLRVLRGANVTINIQGGQGNTMYTGPTQNNVTNNRSGRSRRADRADGLCCICGGIAGGEDIYYYFGDYWTHWRCERARDAARKHRRDWHIVEHVPDELPEPDEPLQIAAPEQPQKTGFDLRAHLAELDAQYEEQYQQLLDNAVKFRESERRYFADLSAELLSKH